MPFPDAAEIPFETLATLSPVTGGGGGPQYTVAFANDIAGRDAAGLTVGQEIYVADASADPNVDAGPAKYLLTPGGFVQVDAGSGSFEQRVDTAASDPPLTSATDAYIWIDDRDGTTYARFGTSWVELAASAAAGDEFYVHTQAVGATTWNVIHAMTYQPGGITVTDNAGNILNPTVTIVSPTQIQVSHATAQTGFVYLS